MKYTQFGNTGISVSRICLGMMTYGNKAWREWILEYDDSLPILTKAWEAGINFYDTADVYSNGASEEVLGKMIKDLAIDREEIIIATKCFNGTHNRQRNRWGLSRKHIMAACDASLKRLDTDYIDLYQIHRFDYKTPVEETIDALSDLVRAGKVRYVGASSMFAWQMAKYLFLAKERGGVPFASMQNYYNLLYREEEREMIPLCQDQKIALIPWSPLARGYLTRSKDSLKDTLRANTDDFGKMLYNNPADLDIIERNAEVATRLGVKPAQTALSWVLNQPGITSPIIGASKLEQLEDALGAIELELSEADQTYLEEAYTTHTILGHT
jgi:aryl-alcohol dehydrogenase-like predicted oxidoreductase